jgi:hypothetical protein
VTFGLTGLLVGNGNVTTLSSPFSNTAPSYPQKLLFPAVLALKKIFSDVLTSSAHSIISRWISSCKDCSPYRRSIAPAELALDLALSFSA